MTIGGVILKSNIYCDRKKIFVNTIKILGVLCLFMVFLSLQACSVDLNQGFNTPPDEIAIKQDIQKQYYDNNYYTDYSIDNVVIDKMKTNDTDKSVHYWIFVYLSNNSAKLSAETECYYEYFDKGGWIFQKSEQLKNRKFEPLYGIDENTAYNEVKNRYSDFEIKLDSHINDFANSKDYFQYTLTDSGRNFDIIYSVNIKYDFFDGKWKLNDFSIRMTETKIHPSGIYNYEVKGDNLVGYYTFEITGYNDNNIDITYYNYIHNFVISNSRVSHLNIQHYTVPCNINNDEVYEFSINGNNYIIDNNSIYCDDEVYEYTSLEDCVAINMFNTFDETEYTYIVDRSHDGEEFFNYRWVGLPFGCYYNYYSKDYKGEIPNNAIKIPNVDYNSRKKTGTLLRQVGFKNVQEGIITDGSYWYKENFSEILTGNIHCIETVVEPGDYLTMYSQIYLLS